MGAGLDAEGAKLLIGEIMFYQIYQKIPEPVKKPIRKAYLRIIPFPYSQGLEFSKLYLWLMKTQWKSPEEIEKFQNAELKKIILHSYENAPYYRKIFDKRGIKPEDINNKNDLTLLPILTKDDIRNNFKELTARNLRDYNPKVYHTSGSTGEPLQYYLDKRVSNLVNATVWRNYNWCGIKYGQRVAVLRGSLVGAFGKKQEKHYKILGNELHFSSFHMTDEVMAEYAKKINEFKPSLIRGYPASLEIFGRFLMKNNLNIHKPVALHTSSEVLFPEQRKVIEEAFKAPVFDWYAHGESTVCAGECGKHEGLHLNSEFGLSEFVKTDETKNMENVYNIVSTSLWNYSMPLIRYDSEDLVLIENKKCSCGRPLPLIKEIVGRRGDILTGIKGNYVSPTSLIHFWKYQIDNELLSSIKYYQVVQNSAEELTVKVVGEPKKENEGVIRKKLTSLLGDMKIEFEYLPDVPTGEKWRFTVSKIR